MLKLRETNNQNRRKLEFLKFEYLNGVRGFLAFGVIVQHACQEMPIQSKAIKHLDITISTFIKVLIIIL